jgi:hypothetical protein
MPTAVVRSSTCKGTRGPCFFRQGMEKWPSEGVAIWVLPVLSLSGTERNLECNGLLIRSCIHSTSLLYVLDTGVGTVHTSYERPLP